MKKQELNSYRSMYVFHSPSCGMTWALAARTRTSRTVRVSSINSKAKDKEEINTQKWAYIYIYSFSRTKLTKRSFQWHHNSAKITLFIFLRLATTLSASVHLEGETNEKVISVTEKKRKKKKIYKKREKKRKEKEDCGMPKMRYAAVWTTVCCFSS